MDRITRRYALGLIGGAALTAAAPPAALELTTADGRTSSISRWTPPGRKRGTILFSHGALSAPWKYEPLVGAWAQAGYEVLAPLHVDSSDHPDTARYKGPASWPARLHDMRALAAYVPQGSYIAAGHSYGGLVALTLGGASPHRPEGFDGPMSDPRVRACVAFSPPGPLPGLIDAAGYSTLQTPAFIQTGDQDVPPGSPPGGWQQHLAAYEAAAAGHARYALVLNGVDHYFGGLICRPELPGPPQREQFAAALQLSLLFIHGFGAGRSEAWHQLNAAVGETGVGRLARK